MKTHMTYAELEELPVTFDLAVAAKALGLKASAARDLVERDEFPVRVVWVGSRCLVTRADLLRALGEEMPPASVDLLTATKAIGMGRTTAYDLAKRGQFPVRLLRVGNKYRVRHTDLIRYLGAADEQGPGAA